MRYVSHQATAAHTVVENHPFSLTDWHRFLFGNTSSLFLLEVLLRTGVTYVLLVIAMRLLGRRVAAQYTLFEISIVVTLAAAIGVPLQASNRGMLPPLVIALVAIVLQRLIARLGTTHRRLETLISTDVTLLVSEGRLEMDELARAAMPREKVFEAMRIKGWQHLDRLAGSVWSPRVLSRSFRETVEAGPLRAAGNRQGTAGRRPLAGLVGMSSLRQHD